MNGAGCGRRGTYFAWDEARRDGSLARRRASGGRPRKVQAVCADRAALRSLDARRTCWRASRARCGSLQPCVSVAGELACPAPNQRARPRTERSLITQAQLRDSSPSPLQKCPSSPGASSSSTRTWALAAPSALWSMPPSACRTSATRSPSSPRTAIPSTASTKPAMVSWLRPLPCTQATHGESNV